MSTSVSPSAIFNTLSLLSADFPFIKCNHSCRFRLGLLISKSGYAVNQRLLYHLIHFILMTNKKGARVRMEFFDETLLCLDDEVIMRVLWCLFINTSSFLWLDSADIQSGQCCDRVVSFLWKAGGADLCCRLCVILSSTITAKHINEVCSLLLLLLFTMNYFLLCQPNMQLMTPFLSPSVLFVLKCNIRWCSDASDSGMLTKPMG